MHFTIDPHAHEPPSQQIVAAILDALARGELGAGDRVPSVRGLAQSALVNPNTVGRAYRDLEHLGVVLGRNGAGVFVTERGPQIARRLRQRDTLAAFTEAVARARAAGHEESTLRIALEDALAQAEELTGKKP